MPRVLLKEPNEIGWIVIAQFVSYLIDLVSCSQQIPLAFQNNLIINELRGGFTQQLFSDSIELKSGKIELVSIIHYLFVVSKLRLDQRQKFF